MTRLFRLCNVVEIQPPTVERWTMDADDQQYLRDHLKWRASFQSSKLESMRMIIECDPECGNNNRRPLSPPLVSRQTARNTPLLTLDAAKSRITLFPKNHRNMMMACFLKPVGVTAILDDDTLKNADEELSREIDHHPDETRYAEPLKSSLPNITRPGISGGSIPLAVQDFLFHPDSPPIMVPRPITPPLFPRDSDPLRKRCGIPHSSPPSTPARAPGLSERLRNLESPARRSRAVSAFPELVGKFVPRVKLEDFETNLTRENMAVVDGWTAYVPAAADFVASDPPVPSLIADQSADDPESDDIDEILWEQSPQPEKPFFSTMVAESRMDNFLIPRVQKRGFGSASLIQSDEVRKRLRLEDTIVPFGKTSQEHTPEANVTSSISEALTKDEISVGQPVSDNDEGYFDTFDSEIRNVYPLGDNSDKRRKFNPYAIIMDVPLEDEDDTGTLLLKVPLLPEPNARPVRIPQLTGFKDLLAPPSIKGLPKSHGVDNSKSKNVIRLAKVQDLAPLNIELSWSPFVTGTKVLTHMDAADISMDDFDGDEIELNRIVMAAQAIQPKQRWRQVDELDDLTLSKTRSGLLRSLGGFLLTRAERCQLSARSGVLSQLSKGRNDLVSSSPQTTGPMTAQDVTKTQLPKVADDCPARDMRPPNSSISTPSNPILVMESRTSLQRHSIEQTLNLAVPSATQKESIFVAGRISITPTDSNSSAVAAYRSEPAASLVARFRQLQDPSIVYEPRVDTAPTTLSPSTRVREAPAHVDPSPTSVPSEMIHPNSLLIPQHWITPSQPHRYMVSLNLIQRRAVTAALCSHTCNITLAERDRLWYNSKIDSSSAVKLLPDGPDVLIDSHTAVLLITLASIITVEGGLRQLLETLSQSFTRVLIVFEAYPKSKACHVESPESTKADHVLNMFTPPVLSAFNRWRRLLDISVAIDSINTQCKVDWVFARTPKEAAEFIRLLGDHTEEHTDAVLRPHLWDSREWVLEDPTLEECDLTMFPGMNCFCSAIILSRTTPEEFLDFAPLEREQAFGPLIGHKRITAVNEELARREAQLSSSIPPSMMSDSDIQPSAEPGSYEGCNPQPIGQPIQPEPDFKHPASANHDSGYVSFEDSFTATPGYQYLGSDIGEYNMAQSFLASGHDWNRRSLL
ncbi:uncharacterized protein EI90DRAFT_3156983 [Cantharellus anzutake]|uniref:uncharacterized protein n=1 Tax=Cantharellus anzutake TaxID=1750568 RepID=UPI001907BBA6|nr:uncharacterized protein EI90DRAFT_3156983 [Cantharellus anzutake]KAF8325460.1 hypothetical protein EI90DRAFT_3156983 [Cantharellus anzutake]